jgi:hypothetical protein
MAFRELKEGLANSYPPKTSERYKLLDAYEKVLDGSIYEHLAYPFSMEKSGNDYVPMLQRRPSVKYLLPKIVVNQCASLMFGDEQAPTVRCWDEEGEENNPYEALEGAIETIVDRAELEACMQEAIQRGSIGSVAILLSGVGEDREAYWEVVSGKECRPLFDPRNPRKLVGLERLYSTFGQNLLDAGYEKGELIYPGVEKIENFDPNARYWVNILIDQHNEVRYYPMSELVYNRLGETLPGGITIVWRPDKTRSFKHGFNGTTPVIYIKQLKPISPFDGECTFGDVVDICIEMDYQLSQIGRGIRYSADPMMVIGRGELANQGLSGPIGENALKGPDGGIAKTSANVIELEAGATAALLEITGKGFESAGNHISMLREYALEVIGGMKSEAEDSGGPQSGRAMEMLWETVKLLVKRLRVPYGNRGLIPLIRLVMIGILTGAIRIPDVDPSDLDPLAPMRLIWPKMSTPRGADMLAEATALATLAGASKSDGKRILGDDTITRMAANTFGITDANAALKEREADEEEDAKAAQAQADQEHAHAKELVAAKPAPAGPFGKK